MTGDRHLTWEGCYNARDLGGLNRRNGGETRWRAVVRADNPQRLTAAAWAAAHEYGIRTIIDLRAAYEAKPDARPAGITSLNIVLNDESDIEFWDHWGENGTKLNCTPLYYTAFLERFPHKIAEVCAAIANADPGGVMIHCAAGRDRTGLISLVLLALADVEPDEIAADHALSTDRLKAAWAELNLGDQTAVIEQLMAAHDITGHDAILAVLNGFDARRYLLDAGVTQAEIDSLLTRMT
jgi:protein-tyrosine phosphatase